MKHKFITIGEIMLRLTPPDYEKIRTATSFEARYGGSEANVALSLANLGVDASFFTVVPGNSLGKSAVRMLRSNDVNCDSVVYSTEEETPTHRLGTYYLETGYGIRPSKVVYDRKHSAFSEYDFSKTDVKKLLEGYTWLHLSGITPALGKSCSELILTCLKTAKENGMTVIARIYAFRDPLSSLILKKAAVKYQDTEMLWLDNSKENGGKSWLNPYSEVAQMYIADLSLECVRAGCSAIMLDGVQFPAGYSLELAGYGAQTKSRQQVLSDFVQDMEELLKENNGTLIYASSAQAMLGMETSSYDSGGLYYPIENFCPDVRPVILASGVHLESLTMADPAGQPYDTVKAVLLQLKASGADKSFLPMLQAYTDASSSLEYTAVQIEEQIRALEESGITGYILYNEQGNYPLS